MSFASLWNIILDIVFPPVCMQCGAYIPKHAPHTLLCASCKSSIVIRETLLCATCHARLPDNKPVCHRNQNPFYLLGAASDYDNPALKTIIHALKYQRLPSAAPILAEILSQYIENCELKIENSCIIPIPLHPARERERGFNQAFVIAKELEKKFGIPIEERLMRIKHTAPQVTRKNKEQRKENIRNCFQINNNHKEEWKEKTILLLDDVTTSGETIKEAVRALRAHGAKKIIALVVAKA